MNTQRRIFRGRGGPTDGRLPKHNARRRRANKPAVNKYGDESRPTNHHQHQLEPDHDDDESASSLEIVEPQEAPPTVTTPAPTPPEEPWKTEIHHLKKRLRNVQESIQTGTLGISNPKIYQENVLNAVLNCLLEWKSILKHYEIERVETENNPAETNPSNPTPPEPSPSQWASDEESHSHNSTTDSEPEEHTPKYNNLPSTCIDPEITQETALQVYMLLQLSVQCGPLQGSNPGYFKRCGSAVAHVVEEFLNEIPSDLGFTLPQEKALQKWRQNAHKAALQNKEPSKTALAKQTGKYKKKKLHKKK